MQTMWRSSKNQETVCRKLKELNVELQKHDMKVNKEKTKTYLKHLGKHRVGIGKEITEQVHKETLKLHFLNKRKVSKEIKARWRNRRSKSKRGEAIRGF